MFSIVYGELTIDPSFIAQKTRLNESTALFNKTFIHVMIHNFLIKDFQQAEILNKQEIFFKSLVSLRNIKYFRKGFCMFSL